MNIKDQRGFTLPELLVVVALIGMLLLFTATDLAGGQRKREFENFARSLVDLMEICRWRAISEGAYTGMIMSPTAGSYQASLFLDGNNNGIRNADVLSGVDRLLRGPIQLSGAQGDVEVGFLDIPVPQIPPKRGIIADVDDPIKFGRSNIISFSPQGDSSSGTMYLACHSQKEMYALVLFGATARLMLWRLRNNQWQTVEDR